MPDPIRVLVVDDHASVRAGLLALLAREPGIEPVGGAATAAEAHDLWLGGARADVVVIDQHLPDENGLSLCLWLKSGRRPPAVVLYATSAGEELALPAIVAGADAVVSRTADPTGLGAVVRAVGAGERHLPPLPAQVAGGAGEALAPDDLPILGMLRHAVSPDEIAATLSIAPGELAIRRWAMLEVLTAPPVVPAAPRLRRSVQAMRTLSSPAATTSPGWS